jgi:glycerophosphoryl diester phosphodiesterase
MNNRKPPKLAAWPYPTLFAHRGGGSHAPENTMAAMKAGYAHGYTAVEFDVKLSSDHVAILMHDDTLNRTASAAGLVKENTIEELEHLDAGAWFGDAFKGEKIPRFSAIAKYLHGMGLMANVEIKPCPGREKETGALVGELCIELWKDRLVKPLISSFSVDALRAARGAAPDLPIGLLVEKAEEKNLAFLEELHGVSIHAHFTSFDAKKVRFFHDEGYRVLTYTANDPDVVAHLLDIGIDGIFTDNLDAVARRFAHQLTDSGKAMYSEPEANEWMNVVPPMP